MKNIIQKMGDTLNDFPSFLKYDVLRHPLLTVSVPASIPIQLRRIKGGYVAETSKYPGFIASADNLENLAKEIYDTCLVYFDIPRSIAKRLGYPKMMKIESSDSTKNVVVHNENNAKFLFQS